MQVTIPMQLSKTTKTKTVFATKDGLAPTSNVYVVTEYLTSRGIETKQCFVIISDVPFSDEECRPDAAGDTDAHLPNDEIQNRLRVR